MDLFDNKYNYIKDLGSGGFGRVFLAKEKVSNRYVAIKELKNTDKVEQEDIIHEIEIISKFDHPNIVNYYHHFWQNDKLFLVMEYCVGGSLRNKLDNGKINASVALAWIQTLASCLRSVHKKGIIHHDIKPDNILFSRNGVIKISDFGIANKDIGTRSYMSPEIFLWDKSTKKDPRVDIYALGVTLMELLTGKNPFNNLSVEEIIERHQKIDFPIQRLVNWQQEIILKSINKIPELRFQFMVELEEAIKAKYVPILFKKERLKAAELVNLAEKELSRNKWRNALKYLELANAKFPSNISVLHAFGKYYLRTRQLKNAKKYLEKAVKLNSRLDIQKDLGWINLENKNYPIAMGLLSDHLYRHPSDYEAYNLLIRCYYETNRYDAAMSLAKNLIETNVNLPCFANNYYICESLLSKGAITIPSLLLKERNNPFIQYNYSVLNEVDLSHNYGDSPTLKSKLLFMDFHFNTFKENTLTFLDCNNDNVILDSTVKPIVKFGRTTYAVNDVMVPSGNGISRRHCVIINYKDNVWLYDLESTGTYLNNEKVNKQTPIQGLNILSIGKVDYTITTDKTKLL
jgi:serine/threonine protein kinase